jgi:hypothetical protein
MEDSDNFSGVECTLLSIKHIYSLFVKLETGNSHFKFVINENSLCNIKNNSPG